MARYELPLDDRPVVPQQQKGALFASLPDPVLVRNALAFCRLRWVVVFFLAAFGLAGHTVPGLLERVGLLGRARWPFLIAATLALANLGFLLHARTLGRPFWPHAARVNLWVQIVFDVVVLTVVVYFVGALETPVPFAYLFHIALACIFLSRPESLVATLLASTLYVAIVVRELLGFIPHGGILADKSLHLYLEAHPHLAALNACAVLGIWLVVWYLTSQLSAIVRKRTLELTETNRLLQEAQEEKTKLMLRMTHELKAPFAAIHANMELLLKGYCGTLSEEVREVLERTAARCGRLGTEIQEMLHLARLRTTPEEAMIWEELDLADVLESSITLVKAMAEAREVRFQTELEPVRILAVPEQIQLLLTNVLSNAVLYSYRGGPVGVKCRAAWPKGPVVTVADKGIGIGGDKLPHIFEEYYRTDEAVRHNKGATGLGLAIVQHVAQTHQIQIVVESEPEVGTTFELHFPAPGELKLRPKIAGG